MPKLTPPITVSVLKGLQVGEEVADGGCPGLRARRGAGGVVWSMMIRDADKVRKRIEVGAWPEIGVPEARARAAKVKAGVSSADNSKKPGLLKLDEVIRLYARERGEKNSSWPEAERRTRMVFAPLLDRSDLTPEELQRVADAYKAKSSAGAAVRYIKPILKWAGKRGYTPKGVSLELEQPQRVQKRERVLSRGELQRILPQLGTGGHDGAARMMLLTACRREEVCSMQFEDIIEDVWIVPGDQRKNGEELRVPLSQQAQRLVGAQGRTSGLVFVGDRGKPVQNWNRWQEKVYERTGTEGWHRHDLRRTAATLLGNEGIAPHIIEIVLGHKDPHTQLAGIYNKSRYEQLHEEAIYLLGNLIQSLEVAGAQ